MLMAVVLAVVLAAGVHPGAVGIVAVAYLWPQAFLLMALAYAGYHAHHRSRRRRSLPFQESDFLRGVASEIDAGSSVRQAVMAGAARAPDLTLAPAIHLAAAGRPAAQIAARLQEALPVNGRLSAAAYTMVAESGAEASAVFSGLALRAAAAGELERERRVLTAQARLSALLVGGLPVAVTILMIGLGRGPDLEGAGAVVTALGVGLIITGGLLVWLMVGRR
ncbi:MAG: type II secretion system F family protein [Acidimicrobiia bacterium]